MSNTRSRTSTWTTRDGQVRKISSMDTSHIRNALASVHRRLAWVDGDSEYKKIRIKRIRDLNYELRIRGEA